MKSHRCYLLLLFLLVTVSNVAAQDDLTRVSEHSPFANCAVLPLPGEISYVDAEVEPWIAIDPRNPNHLIGVWQQDRWHFGGARGNLTGISRDGGRTWTLTFAHLSRCSDGNASNGGNYERASDPWVTFSPNGTAYQSSLSFDQFDGNNAVLVSRSTDGGSSWREPTTVILDTDPNIFNDKESITADPSESRLVYAVWDRNDFSGSLPTAPTWFSRTTDGGATWEPARMIYDPGAGASTVSNQIIVLADGTLVNVFQLFTQTQAFVAVIRSTDKGLTWSQPIIINAVEGIGVVDVKTGEKVRSGSVPNIAANRADGTLYVVWQDARFSGFLRDGIVLSKSGDGGLTWSLPVQVNQAPQVQAFTPTIAVARNGGIAVTYYDFRKDTADPSTLLTNYWQITSRDGGATWQEVPLAGPFDLRTAPRSGGFFIGDYVGLARRENFFAPLFVLANSGNLANRTDVFTISTEGEGDVIENGHQEVNSHPQSLSERMSLYREKRRPQLH
jgi:Neuraminidase (sialidase)